MADNSKRSILEFAASPGTHVLKYEQKSCVVPVFTGNYVGRYGVRFETRYVLLRNGTLVDASAVKLIGADTTPITQKLFADVYEVNGDYKFFGGEYSAMADKIIWARYLLSKLKKRNAINAIDADTIIDAYKIVHASSADQFMSTDFMTTAHGKDMLWLARGKRTGAIIKAGKETRLSGAEYDIVLNLMRNAVVSAQEKIRW